MRFPNTGGGGDVFLFVFPLSEDKLEVFVHLGGFFLLHPTLPFCEGQKPAARNGDDSKPFKRLRTCHQEHIKHIVSFCMCNWTETIRNVEASWYLTRYRMIEGFGLEGTLKIIWFQPPWRGQRHLPLDQVAQSPIQPGLEQCQGGGIHSVSG